MSAGSFDFLRANILLDLKGQEKVDTGLLSTQAKIKALASTTAAVSAAMTATGAAIVAPLVGAYKSFAKVQTNAAMVSTMLDKPKKHIKEFTEYIDSLRLKYGELGDVMYRATYDIISASIAPSKAMGVLETSVRSAKAGFTDTATSVDAMTTVLNSYNLEAEKSGDVSDWMFGVVKRGKLTYGEMAQNIGMVAKTASAASIEIEELGAMIALMTRNGIRAPIAISSINSFITKLTAASDESKKAAKEMFNIDLSQNGFREGGGLLGMMKKLQGANVEQLRKLFPDAEAARAIIALSAGFDQLGDDIASLENRAGNTDKAFAEVFGTAQMEMDKLGEAVKLAYEKIGEALEGMVGDKLKEWQGDIQDLTRWITENKETIEEYATLGMKIAEMGIYFIALSAGIKASAYALRGFNVLNGIVSGLIDVGGSLAKASGEVKTFIGLWKEYDFAQARTAAGLDKGLKDIIKSLGQAKVSTQALTVAVIAAAVGGYKLGEAMKEAVRYKGQYVQIDNKPVENAEKETEKVSTLTARLRELGGTKNKTSEQLEEQAKLMQELGKQAGLAAEEINKMSAGSVADAADLSKLDDEIKSRELLLLDLKKNFKEAQKETFDLVEPANFAGQAESMALVTNPLLKFTLDKTGINEAMGVESPKFSILDRIFGWDEEEINKAIRKEQDAKDSVVTAETEIYELRKKAERLRSGATGDGLTPDAASLARQLEMQQKATTAEQNRQSRIKEMAKENLSAHEKEAVAIKEKYDLLQKLLNVEMEYAKEVDNTAKLNELKTEQETLNKKRQAALNKVGKDEERAFLDYDKHKDQTELSRNIEAIQKQADERVKVLQARLAAADTANAAVYQKQIEDTRRIADERIAQIKKEAAAEEQNSFEQSQRELLDMRKDIQKDRAMRDEESFLDKAGKEAPDSAMKLIAVLLDRARQQAEQDYKAAETKNRELFDTKNSANADGQVTSEEQRKIDAAQLGVNEARSSYGESEGSVDRLAQRLESMREYARQQLNKPSEVRGAFGGGAAALGFGLDAAKDPNVEYNKKTADKVEEFYNAAKEGLPVKIVMQ